MKRNESESFINIPCNSDANIPGWDYSTDDTMGSVMSSNLNLVVFEILCCTIGIPPNLFIAFCILRSGRMRSKARYIFLLGVILSNFISFVRLIIDVCYFFWPSDLTCKVFVAFAVLPDAVLLLNSFFSLVDRYVAIRFPLWHRSKVTVSLAISVIICGLLLQIGTLKFMYIAQLVPMRARMRSMETNAAFWSILIPFVLCFGARISVYIQTRRILDANAAGMDNLETHVVYYAHDSSNNKPSIRVRLGQRLSQKAISKLEIEATKVLAFGVTSMLLISFPQIVYMICMEICRRVLYSNGYCSDSFGWLIPYLKQFGQIHGVYHPIINMVLNKEFSIFKNAVPRTSHQQ